MLKSKLESLVILRQSFSNLQAKSRESFSHCKLSNYGEKSSNYSHLCSLSIQTFPIVRSSPRFRMCIIQLRVLLENHRVHEVPPASIEHSFAYTNHHLKQWKESLQAKERIATTDEQTNEQTLRDSDIPAKGLGHNGRIRELASSSVTSIPLLNGDRSRMLPTVYSHRLHPPNVLFRPLFQHLLRALYHKLPVTTIGQSNEEARHCQGLIGLLRERRVMLQLLLCALWILTE